MKQRYRIVWIGVGAILAAAAGIEDLGRRFEEYRYRQAEHSRRQLADELKSFRAVHERVKGALVDEQQRNRQLSAQVTGQRAALDETFVRLTEENRTVRQLHTRLETMNQQMSQLQGELSLALQQIANDSSSGSQPIQLERVVIGSDSGVSGLHGRVVSVHEDWRFVVVSLGWNTVHIGDTVSIFRNEQLVAKAKIERVQEGVSAATLLPEWQDVDVQVNDVVRVL